VAIISVEELAARIGDPYLRVVDTRWYLARPGAGREAYDAGHIPGAIRLDLDADLSDPHGYGAPGRHPLPSVAAFRETMMRAGIGTQTFVVAYDDTGGTIAARLWWMIDNLGHHGAVAVLDGGIQAWTDAGLALSSDMPTVESRDDIELASGWSRVMSRQELVDRLGTVALLDGRAGERYRGEVEPVDPAAGHIPTALSAPVGDNLDASGRFRPAQELRDRFAGLEAGRVAVTYCGSGSTACHNILAARIAGIAEPLLYVGSFSDWSRSGMPVATGPEPGEP
jgi:thiosulfate/3-mercaptopyruvate sulfurtransferase